MSSQFLQAICPECSVSFVVKGSRLRVWLATKEKNPNRKGPYCCYKCSAKANVGKAIQARRQPKPLAAA